MNRQIRSINDSPPLETRDEWDIFNQIMQAIRQDGGSVASVHSLMGVAKGLAYRIQWEQDIARDESKFSAFLLAAKPTPDEISYIARHIYGPNGETGLPDPEMVAQWLPSRIIEGGES